MAFSSVKAVFTSHAVSGEDIEKSAGDAAGQGVRVAIFHALAFTFFNPWVYVDTIVLIGGVSVKYAADSALWYFLAGAILASALWFYGLGFGAIKMAPLFKSAKAWRMLDGFIAVVMLSVAGMLVHHQLTS